MPPKQRSATRKIQGPDETTADQVFSRIAALAPMVARLAPDIEQDRRLPAELVSALKSARIYGMLVPRRYGGLELDAPSASRRSQRWLDTMPSRASSHPWVNGTAPSVASASMKPATSRISASCRALSGRRRRSLVPAPGGPTQ